MKHSERVAPAAAIFSAILSVACCLPLSIPAAVGLAGLAAVGDSLQPWLIGGSVLLLLIGLVQLRRKRACGVKSRASVAALVGCAAIVLVLVAAPQTMANLLADALPSPAASSARIIDLETASLDRVRSELNQAAAGARLILLLSPT